jgi:hypothetical protein
MREGLALMRCPTPNPSQEGLSISDCTFVPRHERTIRLLSPPWGGSGWGSAWALAPSAMTGHAPW